MLTINALSISKDLLLPLYGASGTQLSIHRDYLNISLAEGLLTLVRRDKPLMPFGIEVDLSEDWSFLQLASEQPVRIMNDQIVVGDCLTVNGLAKCKRYSCTPVNEQLQDNAEILRRLMYLHEFCQRSPGADGIQFYLGRYQLAEGRLLRLPSEGAVEQRLRMRFEALVTGVLREDDFLVVEGVHGLLGVGPGLTPSGDDFLVGFLAGLMNSRRVNCRNSIDAMARCLTQDASLFTTRFSAEYIKYAAKGLYHMYVIDLINAFKAGSCDELASAARQLITMGHYSGTDLLLGFAYGGMTALQSGRKDVCYEDI